MPNDLSSNWWKEKTDSWNLSSGLHTAIDNATRRRGRVWVCTHTHRLGKKGKRREGDTYISKSIILRDSKNSVTVVITCNPAVGEVGAEFKRSPSAT